MEDRCGVPEQVGECQEDHDAKGGRCDCDVEHSMGVEQGVQEGGLWSPVGILFGLYGMGLGHCEVGLLCYIGEMIMYWYNGLN